MNESKKYETMVSDFTALLYQKGYRGHFTLSNRGLRGLGKKETLSTCLNAFVKDHLASGGKGPQLVLETYARYKHAGDNILCQFDLSLDDVKGFTVREMRIKNATTGDQRVYRMLPKVQIPGAVAVEGLFPKPKPWDDLMKGKGFRR